MKTELLRRAIARLVYIDCLQYDIGPNPELTCTY